MIKSLLSEMKPGLALAALSMAIGIGGLALADQADARPVRCYEDMACWNWATMGNMQRGVHIIDDAPRVGRRAHGRSSNYRIVDACEFAFLSHWGGLARDTPRLKGDRLAERHGCDYRYFA
jgi:hypothetical protein